MEAEKNEAIRGDKKPEMTFRNFTARVGLRFVHKTPCIEMVLSDLSEPYLRVRETACRDGSYRSDGWHCEVSTYAVSTISGFKVCNAGVSDLQDSGLSFVRVMPDAKGRQVARVACGRDYSISSFIQVVAFLAKFDLEVSACAGAIDGKTAATAAATEGAQ